MPAMPHGNAYNPPRPPEVYTLPDNLNDALPPDIRHGFQHDEAGRVLFFTAPPLERPHKGLSATSAGLGHSVKYLAGREEWLASRERKRKERDERETLSSHKRSASAEAETEASIGDFVNQAVGAMDRWFERFDQDTRQWEKDTGLAGWREARAEDGHRVA
jgi:chromatin structure-remodeling complex subunit RSC1/2